jgi:hypothetical protein
MTSGLAMSPSSAGAPTTSATGTLVSTSFSVSTVGASAAATARRTPKYLGADAQSVTITLNTVNGGTPPSGLTTSVTSSIVPATCPCAVSGPFVPPGSDNFTFTTTDATSNALATSTATFTIVAGSANTGNSVTLLGIPASLSIPIPRVPTPGIPSASPSNYSLTVYDADGATITGTYADPIALAVTGTYGSLGGQFILNGGTPSSSITVTNSSDTIAITDGGLATDLSVTASASSIVYPVTRASGYPATTITYSGPTVSNNPELDLYAPTGTGSSATFSASEAGWTNAPYNQIFATTLTGCGSIGTLSPTSGTSFTFSAIGNPVAGSCTIKLNDGAGQSKSITATYTTSGFGVN